MSIRFVTDKAYENDRIFDPEEPTRAKYVALREAFLQRGYELKTADLVPPDQASFSIFHDLKTGYQSELGPVGTNHALLIESPLIRPQNYRTVNHDDFEKIFTWNDHLAARGDPYVKIHYSFPSKFFSLSKFPVKTKLCVLIGSNKCSRMPNELYSYRRELIRWFERNAANDFDLYGREWDEFVSSFQLVNGVKKRVPFLSKFLDALFFKPFPSYRGAVEDKQATLGKYKFSVAFENFLDESGYITEKLFDSFFAGCIPVYLGADNIQDHIPEDCFIDMRKFKGGKELYHYMKNMLDEEYLRYVASIFAFLESEGRLKFSTEVFAETVVGSILKHHGELS